MNVRACPWALAAALLACPGRAPPSATDGGSARAAERADASTELTAQQLDAWLAWQRTLISRRADAGRGARPDASVASRARAELLLAVDAGLSVADIDAVEDAVGLFVTERTAERLSGAAAVSQFKTVLAGLPPEQRARAEAAFTEASAKAAPSPLPALEARLGPASLQLLLAREAELTSAWDALLEGR